MSQSPEQMSVLGRLVFGLPFCGAGLLILAVATEVLPADPASIHAPMWVLGLAGGIFLVAGLWVVTAGTPLGPIFQWSVGPVVLIGLLTILHWVAFGAGVRKCSGGFSIPFFSSGGPVGDFGCRMAFGYAALLFDGVLAGAALTTLAKKHLEGTAQKIADGVGAALVVIPLLPLFAIAAPALLLRKGWSKLRSG